MDTAETKLNSVVFWLNSNYNQNSENRHSVYYSGLSEKIICRHSL